jgi:hypothetical protein
MQDSALDVLAARHLLHFHFGRLERRPARGNHSGLELIPESHPWRSLGGFLDYEHWLDRDRFVELDEAISLLDEDAEHIPSPNVQCREIIEPSDQLGRLITNDY